MIKFEEWKLYDGEEFVCAAQVPGDITADLFRAGKIPNPYYGLNHKVAESILRRDFAYLTYFEFDLKSFDTQNRTLMLSFEGVDLFADIFLNGTLVGSTKNMFLRYDFDVKNAVLDGQNELRVQMRSTLARKDGLDCDKYFGIFDSKRVLFRKEQCCFGWDWAPDMPGYGIYKPVYLQSVPKDRIMDLRVAADGDGNASFFVELNYYSRSYYDNGGNFVEVNHDFDDEICVILDTTPGGETKTEQKIKVDGNKCFLNFSNPDRRLWQPNGYGKQPLYGYTVRLLRDGEILCEKSGRLGYRTVRLDQKPKGKNKFGFAFSVNGKEIFAKGSNWVPADCFTGCITRDRYRDLLQKAKNANMNMLRVWGGGIYENDCFYDICDELGITVWQDFMFACADIPDDNDEWLENTLAECEYQIKRLRNHPALIYWCGGNEKPGAFGKPVKLGEKLVDVMLRGLVGSLDPTRPYGRQSPCSFTDADGDLSSGDCHCSGFEQSLAIGIKNYRKTVSRSVPSFVSECAVMGPMSKQAFERIFPFDKLWPMNDYWIDRLTTNPYAAIKMNFCDEQAKLAGEMYGAPKSLSDFVRKGMMLHAEILSCEAERLRAHKGLTSGFMNWMYNEIWPNGTWAVVDYYGEPKQAYYALSRSFRPVLMSFYYDADGNTYLFGANDTLRVAKCSYTMSCKKTDGEVVWSESGEVALPTGRAWKKPVGRTVESGTYLCVTYSYSGKKRRTLYSPSFWSDCRLADGVKFSAKKTKENECVVTVCADRLAKAVRLSMPDDYKYFYSDNYFDLEAGETARITVTATEAFDGKSLTADVFRNENEENPI